MKITCFLLASVICPSICGGAEPSRSPITVHVLDTQRGKPAADMKVVLEQTEGKEWREIGKATTGANGRVETLLPKDKPLAAGVYRLTFDTGAYFADNKIKTFYPQVVIAFTIDKPTEHYHVPLILSPFGYSTYRGN
jgi:5-hydroxyisourate hydrolase